MIFEPYHLAIQYYVHLLAMSFFAPFPQQAPLCKVFLNCLNHDCLNKKPNNNLFLAFDAKEQQQGQSCPDEKYADSHIIIIFFLIF